MPFNNSFTIAHWSGDNYSTMYIDEKSKQQFDFICEKVVSITGFSRELFLGKSRKRELVYVRSAIVAALSSNGWTVKKIGYIIGGRDHSTAIHSREHFNNTIKLMATKGDELSLMALNIYDVLNKYLLLNCDMNRIQKIQVANDMRMKGCGIYSVVGVCN